MNEEENEVSGLNFWTAFGKTLAKFMELKPGTKVLDIGTGGGACLIPAAKAIGPSGHAIGIDRWENRITETLENIKSNLLANASAEIKDARELTFDDNIFDLITISFATRNINLNRDTLIQSFSEFYRILKPGGYFINLETSQPSLLLIKKLFHSINI